jgi:ATP-binding cassette subfamily B protein
MILDEPTSALDSWAESDWFGRFRTLARGRTALIITHRFAIARHADMIHVMDAGRIVESGTHADLLARGGLYAQSWSAQMDAHSPDLSCMDENASNLNDGTTRACGNRGSCLPTLPMV